MDSPKGLKRQKRNAKWGRREREEERIGAPMFGAHGKGSKHSVKASGGGFVDRGEFKAGPEDAKEKGEANRRTHKPQRLKDLHRDLKRSKNPAVTIEPTTAPKDSRGTPLSLTSLRALKLSGSVEVHPQRTKGQSSLRASAKPSAGDREGLKKGRYVGCAPDREAEKRPPPIEKKGPLKLKGK